MTLFTIASVVAPGIPDKYRLEVFLIILALLVATCLWWYFAPRPSTKVATNRGDTYAYSQHSSGNVIGAVRDVHQTIYHGNTTPMDPPRFAIKCDATCWSFNNWAVGSVKFLHAFVSVDRGSVPDCKLLLTDVSKSGKVLWDKGTVQLTFDGHNPGDPLPKTLHHGVSYRIDVLAIVARTDELYVCNDKRDWQHWPDLRRIFTEAGDYILTLKVVGDGAPTETAKLLFNWTGKHKTSFLRLAGDNLVTHRQNPLLVALDEFKTLRDEGDKMLASFSTKGAARPSSEDLEGFWQSARRFARSNVFASYIGPKNLATFEQPWPSEDKLAIIATAVDEGSVEDDTPDLEIYGHLWERVERVKQLIGIIENH
jgi:hypothetical protein